MYGDITAIPTLSGQLSIPTQGVAVLIDKTITDNGVYHAIDDNADGYKDVTVALPLGTKAISANGSYNASSDELKGYSSVSVNVQPTLGEKTITTNGTFYASDDHVQGYSKIITEVHGQGVEVVTQSEYDAMSEAQKKNGTVYLINAVYEDVSLANVTLRQQSSTATHYTNDGTTAQLSRGSGSSIGLGFYKSIDVTNLESIEFQLSISSYYGNNVSYPTNDRFALSVSVGASAIGTDYNIYSTSPKVIQFFEDTFTNKKFRLDVSGLTGTRYLNVLGSGVECSVGNFKAYSNDDKIMYMDNKYLKQL